VLTPVVALGGLLVGSFLNVVAHRLPRGESLAHPPSRCPGCGAGVRPYDNVPVLSWLLLRGACRDCRAPISARYPLVEAATAVLFALVALVHGLSAQTALGLVLVALLVPITLIDLDERIIPNRLTGPGALAAVGLLAALDPGALPEHLIAGAGAGLFFGLAAVVRPGGMGMGDVKLAGMLGLFLGATVAFALLVALVAGTVVGVAIMARVGAAAGRKTAVPFGPFLALGGVVALLAGAPVLDAYLSTL
jgi:leader peptidase (prepilin peptidase)/N-methyltransferase